MTELLGVYIASRDMLEALKSGKPLDQAMLERLDRAVSLVKMDEEIVGEQHVGH